MDWEGKPAEAGAADTATYSGKPWKYALIPHDVIAENMTLAGLANQFGITS